MRACPGREGNALSGAHGPAVIKKVHIFFHRWQRADEITHFGAQLKRSGNAGKVELCFRVKPVLGIQQRVEGLRRGGSPDSVMLSQKLKASLSVSTVKAPL